MVRVVWTRRALDDLAAIHAYIAQFAPAAAIQTALRLQAAGSDLKDFPDRGRPLTGTRRELVTVKPYLLRYRLVRGEVEILTIRHGARRPTP